MSFSRRRILMLLATANFFAPFRRLLAAPISSLKPPVIPSHRPCLDAWIGTLIPADEHGPGAVELGVPQRVADKTVVNRGYLKLVIAGCRWLDTKAQEHGERNFMGLGEASREAVAQVAESSEPGSIPRLFFEHTLEDTFFHYYAHRESWEMLGYRGPPQPLGFMDYTQPPKA